MYVLKMGKGVITESCAIEGNVFNVLDVSGTRLERKNWHRLYNDVTVIIYVVNLVCYDQVLWEHEGINRMEDSLVLFKNVCNDPALENTSIILFLNKKDVFAKKIQYVPITVCRAFIGFSEDSSLNIRSFDDASNYIKGVFTAKNITNEKSIFAHLTCATDKENISEIFKDVLRIVSENLMNHSTFT